MASNPSPATCRHCCCWFAAIIPLPETAANPLAPPEDEDLAMPTEDELLSLARKGAFSNPKARALWGELGSCPPSGLSCDAKDAGRGRSSCNAPSGGPGSGLSTPSGAAVIEPPEGAIGAPTAAVMRPAPSEALFAPLGAPDSVTSAASTTLRSTSAASLTTDADIGALPWLLLSPSVGEWRVQVKKSARA